MHLVSHVFLDSNEIRNVRCWTLVTLKKETIVGHIGMANRDEIN